MNIKRVKLMRGVEAERFFAVPVQGEPIMTTDELKLYLGDGNKAGGFMVNADNTIAVCPDQTDATKKLSLAWWIAYFNGNEATVRIPRGTHEVLYDMTIPENICLKFDKGARLKVADTKTLTVNGSIEAGLWQIFDGAGTFAGSPKITMGHTDWFGTVGNGTTDDRDLLQKAFNLFKNLTVDGGKTYKVVNAEGTGADIYAQRADALINNTLYPLSFNHNDGQLIIDGTILGASVLGNVINVLGANVTITGKGTIKGNGVTNDYNPGAAGAKPLNQWSASLLYLAGEGCHVENLKFETPHTIAVHLNNTRQYVDSCYFIGGRETHGAGTYYFNVFVSANGKGALVKNNNFKEDSLYYSVYSHIFNLGAGTLIENNNLGYALEHAVYNYGARTKIIGNTCEPSANSTIQSMAENVLIKDNIISQNDLVTGDTKPTWVAIGVSHASGTVIMGNKIVRTIESDTDTIRNNGIAISVADYISDTKGQSNIKIINNTIKMPILGEAIKMFTAYDFKDIEISHNHLEGENKGAFSPADVSGAILVRSINAETPTSKNISIANNTFILSASSCVVCKKVKEVLVKENYIYNPLSAFDGVYAVIRFLDSSINNKCVRNTIIDDRTPSKISYAIYADVTSNVVCCDNIGRGINVGTQDAFIVSQKVGLNYRNSWNDGDYTGIFTTEEGQTSVIIPHPMARTYGNLIILLHPRNTKALAQQASTKAIFAGSAQSGNLRFFNSAGPALTSGEAGGVFLYEIIQ